MKTNIDKLLKRGRIVDIETVETICLKENEHKTTMSASMHMLDKVANNNRESWFSTKIFYRGDTNVFNVHKTVKILVIIIT